MIREARNKLVEEIRNDSDTFTATGGRVYPQDVATLLNPVYPCITVALNGGVPDAYLVDLAEGSVNIKVYSTKSYNQCWDIYEKIRTALAFGVFVDASVRIRTVENVLPTEFYDAVGRVFSVTSIWDVTMIGT
jgi:hypothetical protein